MSGVKAFINQYFKALETELYDFGLQIKEEVVKVSSRGSRSGTLYRGVRRSAPGEPFRVDTGRLNQSIEQPRVNRVGANFSMELGVGVNYAAELEKTRPTFYPARDKVKIRFLKKMQGG